MRHSVLAALLCFVWGVASAQERGPDSITLVSPWSSSRPEPIVRLNHVEFGEDAAIMISPDDRPYRVFLVKQPDGQEFPANGAGVDLPIGSVGYNFGKLDEGRYLVEVEDVSAICPPAVILPDGCSRFLVFQVYGEPRAPTGLRILPVNPPP